MALVTIVYAKFAHFMLDESEYHSSALSRRDSATNIRRSNETFAAHRTIVDCPIANVYAVYCLPTFIYLSAQTRRTGELIPSVNIRVNKTTLTNTNPPFINWTDRVLCAFVIGHQGVSLNCPEAADSRDVLSATNENRPTNDRPPALLRAHRYLGRRGESADDHLAEWKSSSMLFLGSRFAACDEDGT